MLDEESVLDVCVNPDGSLWVNRLGKGFLRLGEFSAADSALLLSGIATVRDLELNERSPILETVFPLTGNRIEGLVPPIVSAPAFAIRTRQKLEDMAAAEIITDKQDVRNTKRHPRRLHRARARLVSFGNPATGDEIPPECSTCRTTGSGKTTFANSLIHDWHVQTPGDRAVVIEDTPELQCSLENHVYLLATRKISQGELLVAALRLIPKRLVVGEVRESEPARVLLSAWNTGHLGGLATIHADDGLAGCASSKASSATTAVRESA